MKIVKQKKLDLKEMWRYEVQDFTPWLAENIDQLGEQIGMDLEVVGREVSVGPYSADLLARDNITNTFVVIENQLGKTNHDHLGKTITYASALDAKTIVWIASDFTAEHKKAFDWLNDITQNGISFYGIQPELWEVSTETASLHWNIVSSPSTNIKVVKQTSAVSTETTQRQLDYWTRFRDKLRTTKKIKSLQKPSSQYWYDIALGKSDIHISNTCSIQKNKVRVRVYINNKVVDELYPYLETNKSEIEKELGFKMDWNANKDARDKTIVIEHKVDFTSEESIEESLNWMVEKTIKVWTVFYHALKEKS